MITRFVQFLKKRISAIAASLTGIALILVGGYFLIIWGAEFVQNKFDSAVEQQRQELIRMTDNLEQGFKGEIKILQQRLDTTQTVQSGSQVLPDPGFFARLFNNELNKTKNAILDSLPSIIKKEMTKRETEAESVAEVSFEVKGDTIIVPIGREKVEGYWGEMIYTDEEGQEPYYKLVLHPIQIDITEVRTRHDETLNQQVTFFQAVDQRTGQELEITSSNVTFFRERQTGFAFELEPSLGLGLLVSSQSNFPTVMGSLDWFKYRSENATYSFLSLRSNLFTENQTLKHFTTVGLVKVSW